MSSSTANGVESAAIGDLCSLINGRAFKPSEWGSTGLPIIRIQNLNDESRDFNHYDGAYDKKHEVNTGDLLFSWSVTPGTSFGAFFWNRPRGVLNQHIFNVHVDKSRVEKRYFRYAMNHRLIDIIGQAHGGVGLKHITKGKLEAIEIPLPPLSEQKRIADILDKADAIRSKRQEAINTSQEILPSLFADVFGIAGQKYALQSLDEHLEFITSGSRGWAKYYVPKGKRFIRSLDVQMNRIGSDDIAFVDPPSGTEADRTRVVDGDVLVTITGSRIGRVAFIPNGFGEAYVSQHVAIARLKPTLRPRFCSLFLSLPNGGQRQIAKAQYGQTKPGLSLTNIREFQIPQAPLTEQDRFLDAWDKFDKQANHFAQAMTESGNLFNALVQRAFKGEL